MISSEVQRTLVKSPPELWAEISDPDALARHLGEFGEIRITRVHPEQKVEWEADDASGTVVIKPSGWGTKVKLTVTRELQLETVDETECESTLGAEPAIASAPEPELQRTTDVEPESAPEIDAEPTLAVEPALEVGREPESAVEPESEPGLEPESVVSPESVVERESVVEPGREIEPGPIVEAEPEPEIEPGPEVSAGPERRRGLFARLFGRRRSSPATTAPTPNAEADPDAETPEQRYDALAVWTARTVTAEPREQAPAERAEPEAASADEAFRRAPAASIEAAASEIEAEAAAEAAEAPLDAQPQSGSEEPVEMLDDGEPGDIAAEITAAEEVAAEQVTAVLTGVLDRLGAAHHRPFSRS